MAILRVSVRRVENSDYFSAIELYSYSRKIITVLCLPSSIYNFQSIWYYLLARSVAWLKIYGPKRRFHSYV
jgi:hypothetical protein